MATCRDMFSLTITKDSSRSPIIAPLDNMAARINDLPTEIKEQILSFILIIPFGNAVTVTRGYQPQPLTQLSSSMRQIATESYYANSTFSIPSHLCVPFLRSLNPQHRALIKAIHLDGPPKVDRPAANHLEQKAILAGHKLRWRNLCEIKDRLAHEEIKGVAQESIILAQDVIKMWVSLRASAQAAGMVHWTSDYTSTPAAMDVGGDGRAATEVKWHSVKGEVWSREAKGSVGRPDQ